MKNKTHRMLSLLITVLTLFSFFTSVLAVEDCKISGCNCTGCSYYWEYSSYDEAKHLKYAHCTKCSANEYAYASKEAHTFSGDTCTLCGYTKACSHSSTYTNRSGCDWYEYCSDCGALVDSGMEHNYSYGNWKYYNSSRHSRTGTCTSCGSTTTTYGFHSTRTIYEPYDSPQHSYGRYCSVCGSYIGALSYASHSFSYGAWSSYTDSQHRRLKTCSLCGFSEYEYAAHALTYISWISVSDMQHQRSADCAACGYRTTETGDHTDSDYDGCCDVCGYEMARFSVAVPVSLRLTVSENGEVYAASNTAIVNNSTGTVEVTTVTANAENGWTLVPYSTNMANAKVDTKLLGFTLNGAATINSGGTETLSLPNAWIIASGDSLPLSYAAIVSAMSEPVNEQVLTVVFVLNWAVS